ADVDNGGVTNTATATAQTATAAPVVSNDDDATVPAVQAAAATLDKGAQQTSYDTAGQAVTFTFTAVNTGNVTVSTIAITDPLAGVSAADCPTNMLLPSAQVQCVATYTVTQADLDGGTIANSAQLKAASPSGPLVVNDTFDLPAVQTPVITIV